MLPCRSKAGIIGTRKTRLARLWFSRFELPGLLDIHTERESGECHILTARLDQTDAIPVPRSE